MKKFIDEGCEVDLYCTKHKTPHELRNLSLHEVIEIGHPKDYKRANNSPKSYNETRSREIIRNNEIKGIKQGMEFNFLSNQTKKVRQLDQISYRFLNFTLYSYLLFIYF